MFGKLKEKLKASLSIFSKKAEAEAKVEETIVEVPKEAPPKKETPSRTAKEEKIAPIPTKEEPKPVIEKALVKKESVKKEVKPAPKPEPVKEKKIPALIPKEEPKPVVEKVVKEQKEIIPSDQVQITYFVHGTTTDNETGLATGHNPGTLSERGKKECAELGKKLEEKKYAAIFSSDLARAVASANLMFPNSLILKDARLREANYGDFNGAKGSLFKPRLKEYVEIPFPHGESYHQVERRIALFLNEVYDKYNGKHIAIVAHQAPQLALEVLLHGKGWDEAIREDWREKKPPQWQPGWEFTLTRKVRIREETKTPEPTPIKSAEPEKPAEKKGFFSKIKETFVKKEEPQPLAKVPPVKEVELPKVEKKAEIVQKPKPVEEAPSGFFAKVKQTLTTKTISAEKFEELFWDLELALLENNVSVEVIEKIKEDLKVELVEKPLPRDVEAKIIETLRETLFAILNTESIDILSQIKNKKPYIITFFGINGAGKTTSIAKIAHYFQKQGYSVVLAACDTFRAAAIQQLEEHAQKLGVKIIKHDYGSDAAAVAFDAVKYAEKNNIDIVLIDTAGRLHSNTNLMAELEKIIRVTKPDLKIFVGESITGNDCIEQARQFDELVELDGAILTKADVDEKGGAPLSISYVIKKPILFLGMGQRYEDLEAFDARKILERLGL